MTCREYAKIKGHRLFDVKGLDDELNEDFIKFVDSLEEIYIGNNNTERGIVANAINDILPKYIKGVNK